MAQHFGSMTMKISNDHEDWKGKKKHQGFTQV